MSSSNSGYVLASTANAYHTVYQYDIAYKLAKHKHLSVIMPPNIGLNPIAFRICEIFGASKRTALIASNQHTIDKLVGGLPGSSNNDLLFPFTLDSCMTSFPEYDAYILFELSRKDRLAVHDLLLPLKNRIVISVARPADDDKEIPGLSQFTHLTSRDTTPHPLVFPVESILDIRDLMFAKLEEKSFLQRELQQILQLYQLDAADLQAKINAKKLPELEEELGFTQLQLEDLTKQLTEKERFISSLGELSVSAGMDWETLMNSAAQLSAVKEKYSAILEAAEGADRDLHINELQNEVSTIMEEFSSKKQTPVNTKAYEDVLVSVLGEDVWRKLANNSKSLLISARMSYTAMTSCDNADMLDFSGVCLMVAKVLDIELSKRIYHLYSRYLQRKYPQTPQMDNWPDGLVTSTGNRSSYRQVRSEEFTLGSVSKTICVDLNGNITNTDYFKEFVSFAKNQLYKPGMNVTDIEKHVKEIVVVAEKVRIDYRNPAAHRQQLAVTSARDCMDYLLDRLKKLRMILKDMRV